MSDPLGDFSRHPQQVSLEDAWRQAQAEWARRQQQGRPRTPPAQQAYRPPPMPVAPPPVALPTVPVVMPPPLPAKRKPARQPKRSPQPPALPSVVVSAAATPENAYVVETRPVAMRPQTTRAASTVSVPTTMPAAAGSVRTRFLLAEILKPPLSLRDE